MSNGYKYLPNIREIWIRKNGKVPYEICRVSSEDNTITITAINLSTKERINRSLDVWTNFFYIRKSMYPRQEINTNQWEPTKENILSLVQDHFNLSHAHPDVENFPMQAIDLIENVARFRENRIVSRLLTFSDYDLNAIAMDDYTDEERMQFAQLIGYSVSGFLGLSYTSDIVAAKAECIVKGLLKDSP